MPSTDSPVAVVGGARLLGRSVARQLEKRGVRPDRLRLSDTADEAGRVHEAAGEASVIAEVDQDLLSLADEVFLCIGPDEAEPLLGGPRARGALWVDLSGAGSARPRVPLINVEANPEALPRRPSGLVAAPGPEAQLLSTLLAPLAERGWIRQVRATLMLPASRRGEAGLDELYQQALGLLNFGEVPREVFDAQMAFNLLPGDPEIAARATRETGRILRPLHRRLVITSLQVPVFHGHALMAHVATAAPVDVEAVAGALEAARGIELSGDPRDATPAVLDGCSDIVVAPPRDDGTGQGLWLWAAGDDLAAGAARNAVRIAAACREG